MRSNAKCLGYQLPVRSVIPVLAALLIVGVVAQPAALAADRFVTGAYGRDSSATGVDIIRRTGFNTVTLSVNLGNIKSSLGSMDRMQARGMRVLVWLGTYDRVVRCGFERSDSWIREVVGAIKGHPAIEAYQVGDEVDRARARGCTGIAQEIQDRSRLIKAVDPGAKTYVTITASDGTTPFPYERFAGTTTIMGLVIYPCVWSKATCIWERIDKAIQHADADGVPKYWVVMQDFGGAAISYRPPSAAELDKQMDRWRSSRLSGYFVYHWKHGNIEDKPGHLDVLRRQNAYYRLR